MLNFIQADVFKLRKSTGVHVLCAITTVCAAAMAILALLIPLGKVDASITGIGFLFSDVNVISILGGVTAGLLICGDFDNKTIQDAIASGYGRFTIIAGKSAVLGLAVTYLLLPYVVITGISLGTGKAFDMGSVAVGFLHLLTNGGGAGLSAAELPRMLAAMLTLLIVYLGQLSVCLPMAFFIRKPVFVVAGTYGLSILTAQLIRLGDHFPVLGRVLSATPYGEDYIMVTLHTAVGDMVKAIVVSLIYTAVMLAATYAIFRKSELK